MEAETPAHVYQPNWSKLSKDDVIDKIKGTLYGQAIGDAIGLATEFMSKAEAKKYYTKKGPSGYKDIVPDFHRSRWVKGDWTDDTDQMLLILLGVVENKGKVLKEDFAKRMRKWTEEGFAELGDRGGLGIGMTTHHTISHKRFLEDPHKAAYDIWESSGFFLAANGAAMRTSVVGIVNFNDLDKVWENTKEISLTTHADPRCTASCIAITTAIALMLQGEYNLSKSKDLSELVNRSLQKALEYVTDDAHKKELMSHAMAKSWDKLVLDDRKTMGYTYKTMGAGFYALRTSKEFRKTIIELVMQGGDADTNGAVAGALMGCKFGFKNLPEDLLNFPHRKWLDKKIEKFLQTIGLLHEQQQEEDVGNKERKEDELKEDDKMEHSAVDSPPTADDTTMVPSDATTQVADSQPTDEVTSDDVTDRPSDNVTNPPSDNVTNPPSDNVTNPPSDNVTNPPSDDVTSPPSDDVTSPHGVTGPDDVTSSVSNNVPTSGDDVTNPPSNNVTNPPSDDVTSPPSDDVTSPPSDDVTSPHGVTGPDDVTSSASNNVTNPPGDGVTKPPSDDITNIRSDDVTCPMDTAGGDVSSPPNEDVSNDVTNTPGDDVTSTDDITSPPSDDVTTTARDAVVTSTH